jgi:hypothetical protein
MSEDSVICVALVALIWIGWPLHSIATDIRALRKLARKEP